MCAIHTAQSSLPSVGYEAPKMESFLVGFLPSYGFSDLASLSKMNRFQIWGSDVPDVICTRKVSLVYAANYQEAKETFLRKQYGIFLKKLVTRMLPKGADLYLEYKNGGSWNDDLHVVKACMKALIFVEGNDWVDPWLEEGVVPYEKALSILKYRINDKLNTCYEEFLSSY